MAKKSFWEHVKPYIKYLFLQKILKANLSPQATKLILILKGHKNSKNQLCNPSQALLSIEMGKSIRSIQRYLKELIEAKIIDVKRIGKMVSNQYYLIIDDELECFKGQYIKSTEVTTTIKEKCNKYITKNKSKESAWNYPGRGTEYYVNAANKLLGFT